jgi:hypothetical protein
MGQPGTYGTYETHGTPLRRLCVACSWPHEKQGSYRSHGSQAVLLALHSSSKSTGVPTKLGALPTRMVVGKDSRIRAYCSTKPAASSGLRGS